MSNAISLSELSKFKDDNSIVISPVDSPIGQIYALTSGSINSNDPYEAMALKELLWLANGV